MTQIGKCDTCRQRKVKCDEERPKCGACQKRDRPCTYSYGKATAFVVQDPNQLTKHGKSKTAPVVYTLDSSADEHASSSSPPSDLRITAEREAENGHGFFQTLAPKSKPRIRPSKKQAAHQKRTLERYLQKLQEDSALVPVGPSSPETTLIARYINMLGSETSGKQPLSILGTWIQSIPSRIGSNHMLDLAVEFLVNSYTVYWDDTFSKRKVARASKAKALKELQLVVMNAQGVPSYEVLLATKMHYAAEALIGIDSMYHAIHAFGLAELLKSGAVSNVDDDHFWNLIDNTYIDDVNEAILAGRKSVYDNEFYLSSTYPPAFDSDIISLSAFQRASMAIMHAFIQCPRLGRLIRHAITNPDDKSVLAAAVSHAESLWQLDLPRQVSELLRISITRVLVPPTPEIADLLPESLEFDSVQSMTLCTRYWMLQNVLCGFANTLHRRFPIETGLSLLPSTKVIRDVDVDAALQLAKSLPWAESVSQRLPLVPLRLHTPLQISVGPWHRIIRDLGSFESISSDLDIEPDPEISFEVSRAKCMKAWIMDHCNRIHKQWDVASIDEKALLEALDSMAGEKIPDWLPLRVRFEAEDGEMVMKLDYENKTGSYQEHYNIGEKPPKRKPFHPATIEGRWHRESLGVQELPLRTVTPRSSGASTVKSFGTTHGNAFMARTWEKRPVDFLHATGRNICSTSGWWPNSPTTSTVPLDSTHNTPAFVQAQPDYSNSESPPQLGNENSYPYLASRWWPERPDTLTNSSAGTPIDASTSPAWSDTVSVTFDNAKKNACLSPAWSHHT
ncbi:uncharacterized protein K460DRAFT_377460 [Cucurbitaria berberidis CBS 394.84]|uniref:Zn(2)-C6 fungal-type domain-containing protein n=1 Tax=Cucurbitaria berberidis CBS 394.84 TaxID=1168544 RepID=A0A9P4L9G2_9PLEO|nr:uncharacterized protein K460DRAFT_377460 [Cucurbitaria berberidis CBS 394.84]KAF1846184.1 hypothetical protein K460DRAFT_377460 [Cucurbitaria berberidis CBS 394.84]